MKLLVAIIQPPKLDTVRKALEQVGIERMTVCDASGYARQRGQSPTYRGHEYRANLLRKVAIEVVVHDDKLDQAVETLCNVSRTGPTGNIGDGKIFVMPMADVIRIADGVRGQEAV